MKYQVVKGDFVEEPEANVNEAIQEGFVPLGGVQVVYASWDEGKGYSESATTFYQAMVKKGGDGHDGET